MAWAQKGTTLTNDVAPTFAECVVLGDWEEREETGIEELLNNAGQLVNVNKADDTMVRVDCQVAPVSTAISTGDQLDGTGTDTRKWVCVAATELKQGQALKQNITLVYGANLGLV